MLRLSVLIYLIILYWCSLYIDRVRCENISRARSSSWFNTKRFFHFDISTLRKLPKSTILLCIVLRCFFFHKCIICETVEKHPANFESVRFFCSLEWGHNHFILIFFHARFLHCICRIVFIHFFFTVFIHTKYWQLAYWLMVRYAFIRFVEQHLLVFDKFKISAIILILSLLITVVCWVRVSNILF